MWLSDLSLGPTSVREEWGSDFYKEDQVHGIFLMSRIDKQEKISQRHTGSLDKQMTAQAAWKKEKICYTLVHCSCRQYSSFWWSSTSMKAGNYTTFFPVPKTWQKQRAQGLVLSLLRSCHHPETLQGKWVKLISAASQVWEMHFLSLAMTPTLTQKRHFSFIPSLLD